MSFSISPGEQRRKLLVVEHAPPGLVDQVVGDIEFGLDDDAEQAVAADHEIEQLLVLGRRHRLERAVRQHHPHRLDRLGERAGLMVHAVGVDRDRAADGEDVGRLHGAHRKARMQHVLDVVPGRARLHRHRSRVSFSTIRLNPRMSSTMPPLRKAWPPMLWRTPAVVTDSLLSRANASVLAMSSTLRTSTTP